MQRAGDIVKGWIRALLRLRGLTTGLQQVERCWLSGFDYYWMLSGSTLLSALYDPLSKDLSPHGGDGETQMNTCLGWGFGGGKEGSLGIPRRFCG